MAQTTFSGPVVSTSGFQGNVTQASEVVTASIQVTDGAVIMLNLPTEDPVNAGQLWNSEGLLAISAGI